MGQRPPPIIRERLHHDSFVPRQRPDHRVSRVLPIPHFAGVTDDASISSWKVYAPTCFTRWKTPRTSTRSPSLMAGVPNVKTFTASPWSESLKVVYGFPRRDVRLLISSAVPVTVTVFWSKAAGSFAISATVAALAHRAGPA